MPEINSVSNSPFSVSQLSSLRAQNPAPIENTVSVPVEFEDDFVTLSTENTDKINPLRLAFSRLTNEQIENVNKTGQLPKGAKFRSFGGQHFISNNFFSITEGTRTIPEGYELRKTRPFGFTRVVLKDTEGLFLKKKPAAEKA